MGREGQTFEIIAVDSGRSILKKHSGTAVCREKINLYNLPGTNTCSITNTQYLPTLLLLALVIIM